MVRFGEPIYLSEYENQYELNAKDTVRKLTGEIERPLNRLTNYIQNDDIEDIVEGLELIYKMELMTELGMELDDKNDDFTTSKLLTDAVQWYNIHDPEMISEFRRQVNGINGKLVDKKIVQQSREKQYMIEIDRNIRTRSFNEIKNNLKLNV